MIDFTGWDHLDPLKLAHAAHLWFGLEPAGNEVPGESVAYLTFQRLKQEVHSRGLLGPNASHPKGHTAISRADLKDIAEGWGKKPAFLYPEERAATARSVSTEAVSTVPRTRGRPPRSGSFAAPDAPLIEEMRKMITGDPTVNPTAAAGRVADRAVGGGTAESKAKRLVNRYVEKFSEKKC